MSDEGLNIPWDKRVVQIMNPRSKVYMLIDRKRGMIIGYSNPGRPFHRITEVKLNYEEKRNAS